jgi:hypothetical protein
MSSADYDDPKLEAEWLVKQREVISRYLQSQGVLHGGVAPDPGWFVAPYVSIWAIQSLKQPSEVGWWAISGDLPTDHLSGDDATDARIAMTAFVRRWREASTYLLRGQQHPNVTYGPPGRELESGDLLSRRAAMLEDWANDDEMWQ